MDPSKKTKTFGGLKRLKTGRKNKDFISELPDPIIVHILSFLPLKDAINTLLVRRFGNLWRKIPVLDMDYCQYDECNGIGCLFTEHLEKFTRIIRHVTNLRDAGTLDKLCLSFYFAPNGLDYETSLDEHMTQDIAEHIEKLIVYALSRNAKTLDVNLQGCSFMVSWEQYVFPNVFTSCYLTELRLTACNLTLCTNIDLKLLKVLFLHEISLTDDTMENFLIGCPLLEDLSVVECYDLKILNCKNPKLKKVRVCHHEPTLFVSCPYVVSLQIDGWIEYINVFDISSVVYVSINFNEYSMFHRIPYPNVYRLLQKVCKAETLSLCTHSILVLSVWDLKNVPCPKFFCKNLKLRFGLNKLYFSGLELLLRSCPSMETLTINVDLLCGHLCDDNDPYWIQHDFEGDSYWDSQEVDLPHLETILIHGYGKEPCMLELVKFLLRSASTLQKMVIKTNKTLNNNGESDYTLRKLLELSQELLRLPRASSQAIICFS